MLPLVVLDLDGTVVGSSGQVEPCIWEKVEALQEAGMQFAVCTGRPCEGTTQRIAARLGPKNPHVFQNGAVICRADEMPVKVFALKENLAQPLIMHAREHQLALELYTPSALYIERRTSATETHHRLLGITSMVNDLEEVARNEPIVRAQWVINGRDRSLVYELELPGIVMSDATSPSMPDTLFVSVTQQSVNKGSGITKLAEVMDVDLKHIMAVGDSTGDQPMLDLVGHPRLMENAEPALHELYPLAGHVDNCGLVTALDEALTL